MLYRVCVVHPGARRLTDNGHPLFVWPRQGAGRVDDPTGDYLVLYCARSPEAAVAEALGRYPRWTPPVLAAPPAAPPGSVLALAAYAGEPTVCDLDDARRLTSLRLRPSRVVTRERSVTQAWARRLHDSGDWQGVSWWSAYDADWTSVGLWDRSALTVTEGTPLALDQPAVVAASERILRPIARR